MKNLKIHLDRDIMDNFGLPEQTLVIDKSGVRLENTSDGYKLSSLLSTSKFDYANTISDNEFINKLLLIFDDLSDVFSETELEKLLEKPKTLKDIPNKLFKTYLNKSTDILVEDILFELEGSFITYFSEPTRLTPEQLEVLDNQFTEKFKSDKDVQFEIVDDNNKILIGASYSTESSYEMFDCQTNLHT